MSLKPLLKKQKIRIDGHQRASNVITDWNDSSQDIHIDKTSREYKVNGKSATVRIRIPINSDRPISYSNNGRWREDIPANLAKEISSALGDIESRQPFLDDLIDTLNSFDSSLDTEKKAIETLERISKHFGLDWHYDKIVTYVNDKLNVITLVYKVSNQEMYFITLDALNINIGEIGAGTRHGITLNRMNKST